MLSTCRLIKAWRSLFAPKGLFGFRAIQGSQNNDLIEFPVLRSSDPSHIQKPFESTSQARVDADDATSEEWEEPILVAT